MIRGRVVLAEIGVKEGPKPVLVVSNGARNRRLPSALGVRVTTTTGLPALPSIVALRADDAPLVGRVLCDDVIEVWDEDVVKDLGAVSRGTMRAVEDGLRHALQL